jgi:hypothetical protein
MVWLRVVVALLVLGAVAVGVLPLLILVDLSSGGTGFGVCPNGIGDCVISYSRPIELSMYLALTLFVFVALTRAAVKLHAKVQEFSARR